MTLATAQNSTSGTSIDFTGIPSWVKRVTVMFNGVSTSGTSAVEARIGTSSGVESTGYTSAANDGATVLTSTTGFALEPAASATAANLRSGSFVITVISSNTWVASGNIYVSSRTLTESCAGVKSLSGTLDRVRITTVNGTDTFDAGSINILYEG